MPGSHGQHKVLPLHSNERRAHFAREAASKWDGDIPADWESRGINVSRGIQWRHGGSDEPCGSFHHKSSLAPGDETAYSTLIQLLMEGGPTDCAEAHSEFEYDHAVGGRLRIAWGAAAAANPASASGLDVGLSSASACELADTHVFAAARADSSIARASACSGPASKLEVFEFVE